MTQEELPFKGISYLELWQFFYLTECNHLCNLSKGYYKKQCCETILILGQWFRRRCRLKGFLSGALVAHLFSGVGTIYATLKDGIMWNIYVKCILNLDQWFRSRCHLNKFRF